MLKIARIALFKHGVGYFQLKGSVHDNELIELTLKSSEMNDMLKSLTALDYDGGGFSAISYDSEEPTDRRLAELNVEIPKREAISSFLDQLTGVYVSVPHAGKELEGQIIGIEMVEKASHAGRSVEPHLAIMAQDARFVRIPLLEVPELQFLDESMQKEMHTLLDILGSSLRKDRKRLTINAVGAGTRQVSLSYVVEAPVWKTSYRLMLPGEGDEAPLLQGWALVDNTTEDDWQGVQLSLVAGLPISFIHDLYTPRHRKRPVVEVEEEAPIAAPIIERAAAAIPAPVAAADGATEELEDLDEEIFSSDNLYFGATEPSVAKRLRKSFEVNTQTQEIGDLFSYEITRPVDIARGQSALVPILQGEPSAERVALYNPEIRQKNPMSAFRLKNTTGLTLEGGPTTVFEGEDYVGEAMLETLRPDDECIVTYSVELAVSVQTDRNEVQKGQTRITQSGSYIEVHYRRLLVTHYRFFSRLERLVTIYIDHRHRYPLLEETPEPAEKTEHFWRFRQELTPKSETEFSVTEVGESVESVHIPSATAESIHNISTSHALSALARTELEKIAALVALIRKLEQEIKQKRSELSSIEKDQTRLRENLKALGKTPDEANLRKRYITKLTIEEDRLEQLQEEVQIAQQKKEQLVTDLNTAIEVLDLEPRSN